MTWGAPEAQARCVHNPSHGAPPGRSPAGIRPPARRGVRDGRAGRDRRGVSRRDPRARAARDRHRPGRRPVDRVPPDARDVRNGRDHHHHRGGGPGARHDGERLHVGVAAAAPRADLRRPAGPTALAPARRRAVRDQRPRRRAGAALGSLRRAHPRRGARGAVRGRPRDPARGRRGRPPRGEGRAFVLGRRPLALPRAGGVRTVRTGPPAPLPRRQVRTAAPGRAGVLLAAARAVGEDPGLGRGAPLRGRRDDRPRRRAGERAVRDPRGHGAGRARRPARAHARSGRAVRRDRRPGRAGADGRRRRGRGGAAAWQSRGTCCAPRSQPSRRSPGSSWRSSRGGCARPRPGGCARTGR